MPVFNKILLLSKQIAASLVKNEEPISLKESDLFSEEDKKHILKNISDPTSVKERQYLKNKIDIQNDWLNIKPKKKTRKLYWQYSAAASITLIVSLSIFLNKETTEPQITDPIIVNNQIKNGSDKATLTLEDGSEVALVKGKTYNVKNATSNGEEIIYQQTSKSQKPKENSAIAYNYLTVHRGGQYQITLSDSTKVWLNSESQLKYPVSFTDGETREVELMYGEAYFEVSPSTAHKGANFKVFNKNQEIIVLGTKFNIKAYKDETNIYTTLVEGKVTVSYNEKKQNLTPNQQSSFNLKTNSFNVETIDVYNEIAWKDGVFSFEDKPLDEIMKVLSRWYDMNVIFKKHELKKVLFLGKLKRRQNIEEILLAIKNASIINNYEIKNKTIILK